MGGLPWTRGVNSMQNWVDGVKKCGPNWGVCLGQGRALDKGVANHLESGNVWYVSVKRHEKVEEQQWREHSHFWATNVVKCNEHWRVNPFGDPVVVLCSPSQLEGAKSRPSLATVGHSQLLEEVKVRKLLGLYSNVFQRKTRFSGFLGSNMSVMHLPNDFETHALVGQGKENLRIKMWPRSKWTLCNIDIVFSEDPFFFHFAK